MKKKTYTIAINALVALAGLCMLPAAAAREAVVGSRDDQEHLTQFVIPVQRWSDGTNAASATAGSSGSGTSPEHAPR